jgi:hypothetical protein
VKIPSTLHGCIAPGLRDRWRYIVYRRTNGSFGSASVREDHTQRAFKDSEHLLPTPDTEPERPHERQARPWLLVKLIFFAAVTILFLRRSWRWLFSGEAVRTIFAKCQHPQKSALIVPISRFWDGF